MGEGGEVWGEEGIKSVNLEGYVQASIPVSSTCGKVMPFNHEF